MFYDPTVILLPYSFSLRVEIQYSRDWKLIERTMWILSMSLGNDFFLQGLHQAQIEIRYYNYRDATLIGIFIENYDWSNLSYKEHF